MGYLLIDHRSAPPSVQNEFGRLVECDTVACKHCQGVIKVLHRQPSGAYCMTCDGPVHDAPPCNQGCSPFKKKLEEALAKLDSDRQLRRLGLQV